MPRRFISQLADREQIEEIFLVGEKQLRANRNGNHYLQARLSDKSGSLTAMLWNATEEHYASFENGDYVRVQGMAQLYNGTLQMIMTRISVAEDKCVDENDFITLGGNEVEKMLKRVREILGTIRNVHLRALVDAFLADEEFLKAFISAPAGVKNHHAYKGGLLEHVLSLMETCLVVGPRYPGLDLELLLVGAFLHDAGKIEELTYERDLGYSDAGQLLGHIVLAVGYVDEMSQVAARKTSTPFPPDLLLRVKHMIVSHHGEYEFGSPKLPMTLEAVALHYLDNMDAKLHTASQLIREDQNTDSNWTPFFAGMQRKFYKGSS